MLMETRSTLSTKYGCVDKKCCPPVVTDAGGLLICPLKQCLRLVATVIQGAIPNFLAHQHWKHRTNLGTHNVAGYMDPLV